MEDLVTDHTFGLLLSFLNDVVFEGSVWEDGTSTLDFVGSCVDVEVEFVFQGVLVLEVENLRATVGKLWGAEDEVEISIHIIATTALFNLDLVQTVFLVVAVILYVLIVCILLWPLESAEVWWKLLVVSFTIAKEHLALISIIHWVIMTFIDSFLILILPKAWAMIRV